MFLTCPDRLNQREIVASVLQRNSKISERFANDHGLSLAHTVIVLRYWRWQKKTPWSGRWSLDKEYSMRAVCGMPQLIPKKGCESNCWLSTCDTVERKKSLPQKSGQLMMLHEILAIPKQNKLQNYCQTRYGAFRRKHNLTQIKFVPYLVKFTLVCSKPLSFMISQQTIRWIWVTTTINGNYTDEIL